MDHLGSTCTALFSKILRQIRVDAHPDKNPNNAESSGIINNAADIVAADMELGGPRQLALVTRAEIKNTDDSVYSLNRELSFSKAALKRRSETVGTMHVDLEAMRVVAAEAEEYASWWKNWAYEKEAAARYAEGDLAWWKEWAYENEAAARHAERDLASWKNWGSRVEEKHEAEQNVLLNQINEFKKRGSEAAEVPWAKKARCTY